ncbi:MAG: hypothetical protein AAF617_10285 [Bacteroidota bacterium]
MSATCKNADHVTLTQQYHYYDPVEDSIIVEDKDSFTLIGYGSLLNNSSPGMKHVDAALFTFQNIKVLTIEGITINGNFKMAKGIQVNDISNATLRDITIKNLRNIKPGDNALGIDIRVINGSVINGDNIRISEIDGNHDGNINSGSGGIGIARALYIKLDYNGTVSTDIAQKNTKITMNNSYFEWVYGDDGDVIDIIDETFTSHALHRFIFTNCTIRYATRRLVKGSASGIQYYNCKFDSTTEDDLIAKMGGGQITFTPSGGVNFRNANPGLHDTFRNMYGKMINCEYRNTGNLLINSGTTLIGAYTDGLEIRGNRFYNTYVRFQDKVANAIVDGNSFFNADIELNVQESNWEEGRSYLINNYGHYAPAESIFPALINSTNDIINVTIDNNKVYSYESSGVNFFGLVRHRSGTKASNVNVSNNEITRVNNPVNRKEYLFSFVNWESSCKVFNNLINQTGLGVGMVFSGVSFSGATWDNYDGDGVEIT